MKKIVSFIAIICTIILIGYILMNTKNKTMQGSGTLNNPYMIADCEIIEEEFLKYYNHDLLEKSDISFSESTDSIWERTNEENIAENIIVDKIQYFGKQKIADLMVIIATNNIDKELSLYLDKAISGDKNIITTSLYSMDFDFQNKTNGGLTNRTPFVLRLSDEVLNNSKMMIISYRINIDGEWYKGETMIIENQLKKLYTPNTIYGEGKIYEKDNN